MNEYIITSQGMMQIEDTIEQGNIEQDQQYLQEIDEQKQTIEAQAKEIKRLEKEFKNRGGKLAQMTYLVKLKYGNKDERIWELICETEKELGLTK